MDVYILQDGKLEMAFARNISPKRARELVTRINRKLCSTPNRKAVMVSARKKPTMVAIMRGNQVLRVVEFDDLRDNFCKFFNSRNFDVAVPVTLVPVRQKKRKDSSRRLANRIAAQ